MSVVLEKETEFKKGDFVLSANGQYKAIFQEDGNFVVYRMNAVWASDTCGSGATRLRLQGDCNLVMYDDDSKACWNTNTCVYQCDTCVLSLTDDGKLTLKNDGHQIWDSDCDRGIKG